MTADAALELDFAGLTDVGRVRARNEDTFDIGRDVGLGVVCDGMGGHAGGDVASRTATESIFESVREPGAAAAAGQPDRARRLMHEAVRQANRRLFELNQQRGFTDGRGMGTTVVGLWLVAGTDRLVVFHAGDSRLYRLRAGVLSQLTKDHSLYQTWLDSGARGQAPQRNIIVRALGTTHEVEPELALETAAEDDLYLLCSDGLSGMVPDAELEPVLRQAEDLAACCRHLVGLANQKGGHDNVTVVLARCRRTARPDA